MRLSVLTMFFSVTLALMAFPAAGRAQGWDPHYPVCFDATGRGGGYRECGFTSIPQCQGTASGRGGECVINPYYVGDRVGPSVPTYRRRHHRT